MKSLGILLLLVGTIWALVAFDTDTTVSTGGHFIGNEYVPTSQVHNIGKMDERRNHLMISSLVILIGVILFAVGKISNKQTTSEVTTNTEDKANNQKCPFCAELIKKDAIICRYCQRELPPIAAERSSPNVTKEQALALQADAMKEFGITYDGEKYHFKEYKYEHLRDALNYAKIQKGKI